MNTIPAFIVSLSLVHVDKLVLLNVQYLNEDFWGARIEQFQLLRYLSQLLPLLPYTCRAAGVCR